MVSVAWAAVGANFSLTGFFINVLFVLSVSSVGVLLIAVPLYRHLCRFGCLNWHYFVLGGALSASPAIALMLKAGVGLRLMDKFIAATFLVDMGVAGGLLFWTFAFRNVETPKVQGAKRIVGWSGVSLLVLANLLSFVMRAMVVP